MGNRRDVGSAVERVRLVYAADHARLWRSIYAFSASADVADEATAEAFAQVLRRGEEVRDVAAWVWRAAYSIAQGELQRRRAESQIRLAPQHVDGDERDARSNRATPSAEDAHGDLAPVLAALATLPERDRQLVVMCHFAGWKPRELTEAFGASAATLRVRLHRSTRRVRDLLISDAADSAIATTRATTTDDGRPDE